MSRARRVVAVITLVAAGYLIALPFALSLFSRTQDAEKSSDHFRPLMSDQGVAQFGANLELVNAANQELYHVLLPELQQALGLDDAQFNGLVEENYPHVAIFLKRLPVTVKYLNPATEA